MACTTILVGKAASYDGSTMIARNDDSGSGHFTAKKFTVIHPEELPKTYRSVLSHVEIPLPEGALRFTAMPNAVEGKGIWAASGVNAANVGMTATETITSNRHRFSGRKRDLVAGDHRRSPLDRPPCAGRCVCGHAQPAGHRHL